MLEQYNMQSNNLKAFIAIFSNIPAQAYSLKSLPVTARKNEVTHIYEVLLYYAKLIKFL